jgi:subtilisin family serine protease
MVKRFTVVSATAILTACGGGGGGGGGAASYSLAVPTGLAAIPALGTATFPTVVTDYGQGIVSFSQTTATGLYGTVATYLAASSSVFQLIPITHLTSDVTSAWAGGWTGQGVTISVIDDFNNASISIVNNSPVISRTATYDSGNFYGKVTGVHDLVYRWIDNWSHGSLVANIAGGDYDGQQLTASVDGSTSNDTKTSCTVDRAGVNSTKYTSDCGSDYYIQTLGTTARSIGLTYKKVAGVAKQANVVNNNVNLSSSQNPIRTVADIQGHLQNSSALGVINLSLGSEISTSGRTFEQVMAEVEKTPLPNIDAVITVAAGNGGAPCASQDLNGCNAVAVAMAFQNATKNNVIVVGALSGTGSSENIATYSTRAGILANRFVLASGEEGYTNVVGTSFAAPRVAGIAAILKQKYPSLTSAQISNIILLSASKDINNDGSDDFTGVSPIYGHGKVSLTRALSLAGAR